MQLRSQNRREPKHIVIVGGGFGGLRCAIELAAQRDLQITLIDKHNYQQFHPLLYQVATSILSADHAAFALRDIVRNYANVDVQMGEVNSIDLQRRTVNTAAGKSYTGDFLVLATGSQVNFYGTSGAAQHTFPLYSLKDAEKLRSSILRTFEEADSHPENASTGLLNFVVVGGGTTGVEMAGTLNDMTERMLQKEFRHASQARTQVFLVEITPSVLSMFSRSSQLYAESTLRKRGVQLHLGTTVKEVTPDGVVFSNGVKISSKTVIWAGGMKATAMLAQPELLRSSNGRIEVQKDLSVRDFAGVYAVGDLANARREDGRPLPQLAAVAQQAGQHCASNIIASIEGEPSRPFVYKDRGILAMIGRNAAVAEFGKAHHEFNGPIAFATWLGVHAALLTVPRARLEAIEEWAWEYFAGEHPGQLIDE